MWSCQEPNLGLLIFSMSNFQKLDEQDFGEKKEINKRKKLILEGKVGRINLIMRGDVVVLYNGCFNKNEHLIFHIGS